MPRLIPSQPPLAVLKAVRTGSPRQVVSGIVVCFLREEPGSGHFQPPLFRIQRLVRWMMICFRILVTESVAESAAKASSHEQLVGAEWSCEKQTGVAKDRHTNRHTSVIIMT